MKTKKDILESKEISGEIKCDNDTIRCCIENSHNKEHLRKQFEAQTGWYISETSWSKRARRKGDLPGQHLGSKPLSAYWEAYANWLEERL